jgi:hypothetical protein
LLAIAQRRIKNDNRPFLGRGHGREMG